LYTLNVISKNQNFIIFLNILLMIWKDIIKIINLALVFFWSKQRRFFFISQLILTIKIHLNELCILKVYNILEIQVLSEFFCVSFSFSFSQISQSKKLQLFYFFLVLPKIINKLTNCEPGIFLSSFPFSAAFTCPFN